MNNYGRVIRYIQQNYQCNTIEAKAKYDQTNGAYHLLLTHTQRRRVKKHEYTEPGAHRQRQRAVRKERFTRQIAHWAALRGLAERHEDEQSTRFAIKAVSQKIDTLLQRKEPADD